MAKHTPGPWSLDARYPLNVYSDDSTGSIVARCGGKGFEYVSRRDSEITANVRLIAAAPDLLEACRDAVGLICNHLEGHASEFQRCEQMMKSAIAKAEGVA